MTIKTPIPGVDIRLICEACQQEAASHIDSQPMNIGVALQYCEHTRRMLFLRSFDGELEVIEVSKAGEREHLEATFRAYWTRWLETAELKQTEIDLDDHTGSIH